MTASRMFGAKPFLQSVFIVDWILKEKFMWNFIPNSLIFRTKIHLKMLDEYVSHIVQAS